MKFKILREFIKIESASGMVLFSATLLALILANSPLQSFYFNFFHSSLGLLFNRITVAINFKTLIDDGLMAIFFLLVSLEIKRELLIGELNTRAKAILPAIAALGGMVLPAIIYIMFNYQYSANLTGWAIPTATDIAFSLGILTLLGPRVPASLKAFLTALAILDDLGAIIIIAIFYTNHIALFFLGAALIATLALLLLNIFNVRAIWPYLLIGTVLWICIIKSGVHATIAGVITGFLIPLEIKKRNQVFSPLQQLEEKLHPWVAYGILPLFALANAGLVFGRIELHDVLNPIVLGITIGLFIGKQFGVLTACWLAIKFKIARLPNNVHWQQLYGVACLCGIGFTMSLFIGTLAFPAHGESLLSLIQLGVFTGSCLAGLLGFSLLRKFS